MLRQIIIILILSVPIISAAAIDADPNASNRIVDADDQVAAGVMKFIGWIGKFHPPATHFPIALIIAAAVAELLFARTGKLLFENARRFCLWFGIITAIGTGALGWCLGGFHLVDDNWLLTTHRWLGTSTVICALLLAFATRFKKVFLFRFILLLEVILVSATGFFGGAMLYGIDAFAW